MDFTTRFVALGDSFTEGVGDDDPTRPNGVRGWADRRLLGAPEIARLGLLQPLRPSFFSRRRVSGGNSPWVDSFPTGLRIERKDTPL